MLPIFYILGSNSLISNGIQFVLSKEFPRIQPIELKSLDDLPAEGTGAPVLILGYHSPHWHEPDVLRKAFGKLGREGKIIILSPDKNDTIDYSLYQEVGVRGFINVDEESGAAVARAINQAVHGEKTYVSNSFLVNRLLKPATSNSTSPFALLSKREEHVIRGILYGKKLHDIADALNLSNNSIYTYKIRAFQKLNISNGNAVSLANLAREYAWN